MYVYIYKLTVAIEFLGLRASPPELRMALLKAKGSGRLNPFSENLRWAKGQTGLSAPKCSEK